MYIFFINCIYCIVLIVYIVLARTCFNERFSLLNVAWLNKVLLLLLLLLLTKKELRIATNVTPQCMNENEFGSKVEIRSSLQDCDVDTLLIRLNYLLDESKKLNTHVKERKLKGLIEIHKHLLLKPGTGHSDVLHAGFMDFDIAFELYCAHQECFVDKKEFRDTLLHPEYGLCVNLVNFVQNQKRYILKSHDVDVPSLLSQLDQQNSNITADVRLQIDKDSANSILNTMSSEWDKKCAKALLAGNKSRTEMEQLGIKPDYLTKSVTHVVDVSQEVDRTVIAAKDCVLLRLREKQAKLIAQIEEHTLVINNKTGQWQDYHIEDLKEKVDVLKEQIPDTQQQIDCLLKPDEANKYAKQKVMQRVKQTASELADFHRLQRRKLGSGAPKKLDSSDEEFIAKAIEDKATYHGRRHMPVMFTHRCVKKRNLRAIANYKILQKGKKMIKSATTAWNRSRPRNFRSHRAKRHLGKALSCTKKPPKAEDLDNENTHHQESHCKNVREFLFPNDCTRKISFMKSMDDKGVPSTRHIR